MSYEGEQPPKDNEISNLPVEPNLKADFHIFGVKRDGAGAGQIFTFLFRS